MRDKIKNWMKFTNKILKMDRERDKLDFNGRIQTR